MFNPKNIKIMMKAYNNQANNNKEQSLHSPKSLYHIEVHYNKPLKGIGSVSSFNTMSLDGIDDYIRRYWMKGEPSVYVIIRKNKKRYPNFEWVEESKYTLKP